MNMIEKVARAIATADEQNGGPPYEMLMTMGKHVRNDLYDRAKAAIEAMHDPTQDMLDAVTAADQAEPFSSATISGIFGEMIDAALEGK